ncbi:MAG: tandem-95 repeat protein, partial [Candidatus Nitrotoga sp.]
MAMQSTPTLNFTVDKASAIKPDTMQLSQLLANDGALPQSALKKNGNHVKRKSDEELLADANSELNGELAQEQPLQLAQAEIISAESAAATSAEVTASAMSVAEATEIGMTAAGGGTTSAVLAADANAVAIGAEAAGAIGVANASTVAVAATAAVTSATIPAVTSAGAATTAAAATEVAAGAVGAAVVGTEAAAGAVGAAVATEAAAGAAGAAVATEAAVGAAGAAGAAVTTEAAVGAAGAAGAATTAAAASSTGGIGAILGSAGVSTGAAIAGATVMGLGVGVVASGKDDPANAAPVAASDTFTTDEESPLNISVADLLGNDRDAEGNPLSLTSVANGTGGTVIRNTDGTITFTPEPNFSGVATFSYIVSDGTSASTGQVSVNVTAVNDAPLNTVPGLQTVAEDTDRTINGISVFDADGSDVTVTLSASNGVLTLSGTTGLNFSLGSGLNDASMSFSGTQTDINLALSGLVYRANPDYNGADTITVTTSDSNPTTASSTIAVNVTPVNDAPVAADDILTDILTAINLTPIKEDDLVPDITFAALTGNDSNSNSNGPANEVGQTLTITGVTSVVGGIVSIMNGQIKFILAPDFNGTASFDYTVQDNGTSGSNNAATPLTDIGRASFTVNPVAEAPRLFANTLTVSEGGTVTIGAANFANVDADTDILKYVFTVSGLTGGKFVLATDQLFSAITTFTAELVNANQIKFMHDGGEFQPSYLTSVALIVAGLPTLASVPAVATINFTNVNDAPVAT